MDAQQLGEDAGLGVAELGEPRGDRVHGTVSLTQLDAADRGALAGARINAELVEQETAAAVRDLVGV